jgi:GWxTD domain-containing protein
MRYSLLRQAAVLVACAGGLNAQLRPVVDTTSASSAAGLLTIVQAYQKEVASNPRDAGLWHDLGMNAWRLQVALAKGGTSGTEPQRIGRLADSALTMAAALELDNVQYQLDVAWRFQAARIAITRVGSRRYLERGLEAARKKGDPILRAVVALELGRTFWWNFDAVENRYMFTGLVAPRSVSDALNPLARAGAELEAQNSLLAAVEAAGLPPQAVKDVTPGDLARMLVNVTVPGVQSTGTFSTALSLLRSTSKPLPGDLSGQVELERATALFIEAYQAAPGYPGAFRAVAMTWVARNAWPNLERAAAAHLKAFPRDAMAQLALGLARYRQGKLPHARTAFDSALAMVNAAERERLSSWKRILPPGALSRIKPDERVAKEALFWRTASPFWSDSTRDPRTEFLARVAHAELRWSVEEFGLSGADSDRGDVFIRYGPPKQIMGFGASVDDRAADVVQFWIYESGFLFAFYGMPTFAVMRTAIDDRGSVAELKARMPNDWTNIDAPGLDSLQSSVSRFRAGADSVDLAIGVEFGAPDSIVKTMSLSAPVLRHLWIVPTGQTGERHRSVRLTASGTYQWKERVAAGTLVYRAEAFAETATRGARVTGVVDATPAAFPLTGFGLSDLMAATAVTEPPTPARRWSDLQITPSISEFAQNAPVTFVWENYEFGERAGQAEYDATLTIRNRRSGAGQFAAEILGALSRVARVERAPDQTTITFSRTVPRVAAFADWITVQMTNAPGGEYDVTLTVTDKVTQKQAVRSTRVTIRE